MKLNRLIDAMRTTVGGDIRCVAGAPDGADCPDPDIQALYYRAQQVAPGGLFVAIKGIAADGHDYIPQAVERGAVAIVCERPVPTRAVTIQVQDSRKALAALAAAFFGHPSRRMTVVGITGTNGKTTTSYLIESILVACGLSVGVIGTVNYRYAGRCFETSMSTPESLDLQRILADMRMHGVTHVVMEISSHALDLERIHACEVDVAVFTNLSQDHLDFHHDMDTYWASKRRLFTHFLHQSIGIGPIRAVINIDDPRGRELHGALTLAHVTTGLDAAGDIRADAPTFDLNGIQARIHTPGGIFDIHSGLTGRHNLENILSAVGVSHALGLPTAGVAVGIQALHRVPGRLERVAGGEGRPFIYVDYAHTPDALSHVLSALRALTTKRLICVFGCGGDRDRTKRPLMGAIATNLADLTIITSDNPRTEPPDQIMHQVVSGIPSDRLRRYTPQELVHGSGEKGYVLQPDRRLAIGLGICIARQGDTILIAGKGHETYQIIGREKMAFDDRRVAAQALANPAECC